MIDPKRVVERWKTAAEPRKPAEFEAVHDAVLAYATTAGKPAKDMAALADELAKALRPYMAYLKDVPTGEPDLTKQTVVLKSEYYDPGRPITLYWHISTIPYDRRGIPDYAQEVKDAFKAARLGMTLKWRVNHYETQGFTERNPDWFEQSGRILYRLAKKRGFPVRVEGAEATRVLGSGS